MFTWTVNMFFFNIKFKIFKRILLIIFPFFSFLPNSYLKSEIINSSEKDLTNKVEKIFNQNEYILDSGDILFLKFEDFPEFNLFLRIQNDGNLYLPKVGKVKAENLLIGELNELITKKYSVIMISPLIDVQLAKQRPIKVILSGEVTRPGLYTLTGGQDDPTNYFNPAPSPAFRFVDSTSKDNAPTLYEGIKTAKGITDETDLENIELRRKIPKKYGGGYKKTNLNLLSIFIDGDESNNIKLMDGDVIIFKKSKNKIASQIMRAAKTNLNPSTISVYVTGRVRAPGLKALKYGTTLNEAIAVAGGPKALRGKVELISSKNDQLSIKSYAYKPKSTNSKYNPTLKTGDIVRIGNSGLSAGTELFSEILPPIIGIGTVKNILE